MQGHTGDWPHEVNTSIQFAFPSATAHTADAVGRCVKEAVVSLADPLDEVSTYKRGEMVSFYGQIVQQHPVLLYKLNWVWSKNGWPI